MGLKPIIAVNRLATIVRVMFMYLPLRSV